MHVASARVDARFSDEATADTFLAAFGARLAALGTRGIIRKIKADLAGPCDGWRVVAMFTTRDADRTVAISWANGELYAPAYAGRVLAASAHECERGADARFTSEREVWSR